MTDPGAGPREGDQGVGGVEAKHQIGLIPCVAFCVGTMIGGGVFTLSGLAVDQAGPSAILAYLIAGVVMMLSALSFVAVSSRSRPGDSGYAPLGEILSPGWRFVVMWGFYLNAVALIAFVLLSFGSYLNEYFVESLGPTAAALLAVAAIALLNLGPADLVGKAETWLVALKVGILILLAGYGLAHFEAIQWSPFFAGEQGSVLTVTAMLFTAYTGFNVVTNMAGSVRDPDRTVPRAIVISILVAVMVYMGVIVSLLASGQSDFGEAGLGKAAAALMGSWGEYLVAFAACVSTLSGANANLLGASELMIRLSVQGDAPAAAGRLSGHGHPVFSVLLAGGIGAALIALSRGGSLIINISNVTAILAMLVVNVGAFQLGRKGWPGKGVKLPGGVLIPVLGFAAAAFQLPSLGLQALLAGTFMMIIGVAMYAVRQWKWLAGDLEGLKRRIVALETPLLRALRRLKGAGGIPAPGGDGR